VGAVTIRVYGELNDFLPAVCRQSTLVCEFKSTSSVKDLVEALGVPHPEVDVIVVNGRPVNFDHAVLNDDRIAVFPRFRTLRVDNSSRLGPDEQGEPRFVADVHLGRLAAYLRLAGFDTKYQNDYPDPEIVAISAADDRTVLTRDVGLLKHRAVRRGYFLRETLPARQFVEVLRQFNLVTRAAPFSRCVRCNTLLEAVSKNRVAHLLEPRTSLHYREFSRCPACERIYWQGSHYSRMRLFIEEAFAAAGRTSDR
jgi:uncharacterized protein with PIN domain/sulfur carrier protein ThiS